MVLLGLEEQLPEGPAHGEGTRKKSKGKESYEVDICSHGSTIWIRKTAKRQQGSED